MNEYIDKEITTAVVEYLSFTQATGLNYEQLHERHVRAVATVDEARKSEESEGFPIMAISPRLYAYLTDLALRHLAIGAGIQQRHVVHED